MFKSPLKSISLGMLAVTMTACSDPASNNEDKDLRIAALDDSAWQASVWISAADAPVVTHVVTDADFRSADGAAWFVSTLRNDKRVTSARWMTTGLGIYQLFINGKPVGKEVLKPGFTHYAKTRRSLTYDITPLLDAAEGAENVLSAQVTPGWWADKIVTPSGTDGMNGHKVAFRGVLEVTYADGSKQLYGTNLSDWKAGIAGPVRHAGIFDGEEYDARELPGYACIDRLSTPEENKEFEGEILPSEGAEVYLREDLALAPVTAYVWQGVEDATAEAYGRVVIKRQYAGQNDVMTVGPGETLVIDFGQNAAAVPQFTFKAKEGTTLTCLPAELLNDSLGAHSRGMDGPEGSCHRLNLRIPDLGMRVIYTFAQSEDYVTYHPTCSFFGYRYISVTATDEVSIQAVASIPVSSITRQMEIGHIITGNNDINQIISNTLWGQRSNYLSVTTDCPQRNERLGWTADTQVFSETGTFFANTDQFFHKWMRDMRDTQSPLGGFPGVAPFGQYCSDERSMMRVGWADAGIIVPWTVWKQFADPSIIEENWQAMDRYMQHVNDTHYEHVALSAENANYQWGDWLSYEPLESCGHGAFGGNGEPLPEAIEYWSYLGGCYWLIDAGMMRDMAKATGRDATVYQQMQDNARSYLRERFLRADGTFSIDIFNTMQTPALFALKCGLLEGEALNNIKVRVRENFAQHGNCLQTGFLGTSILMQTLSDYGMTDIAYELLLQRKNPSWLYSVDNGATTMWERWNSYMIEHGMGPRGMNSFNHYAYGCVCQWLWETAAGIQADTANPGFRHIILRPVPDKRLGWLKAEYQSAAGLVVSEWHYDGEQCTWTFTVPDGATATVILPDQGNETKEYTAGTYTLIICN